METIREQKADAIKRIEFFLDKLKKSQDPFDIEAYVYAIHQTTERAHTNMHRMNSEVITLQEGTYGKE